MFSHSGTRWPTVVGILRAIGAATSVPAVCRSPKPARRRRSDPLSGALRRRPMQRPIQGAVSTVFYRMDGAIAATWDDDVRMVVVDGAGVPSASSRGYSVQPPTPRSASMELWMAPSASSASGSHFPWCSPAAASSRPGGPLGASLAPAARVLPRLRRSSVLSAGPARLRAPSPVPPCPPAPPPPASCCRACRAPSPPARGRSCLPMPPGPPPRSAPG